MSETEYELEPTEPESAEGVQPPDEKPIRPVPGQPLPRLWKTEPDPDDETDDSGEGPGKSTKKRGEKVRESARPEPRPRPKARPDDAPRGEKKVLLEETPAFDTIESRRRARAVVGGLMVFCLLILGWIVYGMLFPGSDDLDVNTAEVPPQALTPVAPPSLSREPEAEYMLDRARDYAKRQQVAAAVAMLERVATVYRGTKAAVEARAALDRPRQNLPLFPDGPFLVAQRMTEPAAPPATGTGTPPPSSTTPPGTAGAGPAMSPGSTPIPPPQVVHAGPPPGPPPAAPGPASPGGGMNPGTVVPASPPSAGPGPGPGTVASASQPGPNPGTGATAPAAGLAMGSRLASNAPLFGAMRTGTVPPAPAPGPIPGPTPGPASHAAPTSPPPAPGDATIVMPGNPNAGGSVTPPPGGNAVTVAPPDRSPGIVGRTAKKLPPGFRARPEAGVHESGWPLVIVGSDGANMVLVPGATFTMGSDRGERAGAPAHFVQLSTYYIDQHEVTNKQFRAFLEESHYRGQPPGKWLTDARMRDLADDLPAVFVSYQDVEEYAIWAHKRLPTEAQWELAARSVDGRRHPWGDEPARWSRPRKLQQIDPVMSFPNDVSPYGVFDLAGNAVEWVRDWYDPAYYARLRDKTTLDPTGPPNKRQGIQRVVRGTSRDWLMTSRNGMDSDRRLAYVGFRCSLAVEGSEASAVIAPHPVKPATPQPGNVPPGQGAGNDVPF